MTNEWDAGVKEMFFGLSEVKVKNSLSGFSSSFGLDSWVDTGGGGKGEIIALQS